MKQGSKTDRIRSRQDADQSDRPAQKLQGRERRPFDRGSHTQDGCRSRKGTKPGRADKRKYGSKIEKDIPANAAEQESREGRGKEDQAVSGKIVEGHGVQTGARITACKNNGKAALVITCCLCSWKTGLNMISTVHLYTSGAGPQVQELFAADAKLQIGSTDRQEGHQQPAYSVRISGMHCGRNMTRACVRMKTQADRGKGAEHQIAGSRWDRSTGRTERGKAAQRSAEPVYGIRQVQEAHRIGHEPGREQSRKTGTGSRRSRCGGKLQAQNKDIIHKGLQTNMQK